MSIDEALVAQLKSYGPLSALIGGNVLANSISEHTPLPAVTYQRISSPPIKHRGRVGSGPETGSLTSRIRWQVDGWAANKTGTIALRRHIRAALTGWTRANSPRVEMTFLQDDRDLRDPETGRFRASMDFVTIAEEN